MIAWPPSWLAGARGDSPLTAVFGVAVLLGFLLLASQVLVHLAAVAQVTAVAADIAHRAAAAGGDCPADDAAVRARLGTWGRSPDVRITCVRRDGPAASGGRLVEVRIAGPSPARARMIDRRARSVIEPAGAS